MTQPSHFKRIARDLEKLPCELHESVLVELEFSQLIRLSQNAGPRLQWSLENSLSSWGVYFKGGSMTELQRLLLITDRVKKLCFRLPKTKDDRPHVFEDGSLSFLQRRNTDWSLSTACYPHTQRLIRDYEALFIHWLASLNHLVIDATWNTFHHGYHKYIKPWSPKVDGAAEVFELVPHLGKLVPNSYSLEHEMRMAFSIDDLASFIDAFQKLRLIRAEALAAELCRLADIYSALPALVKTPFAPQTPSPNKKHIPDNLRFDAQKLIKRAINGRWTDKELSRYRFRFPFTALVPFDWTTTLFNKVWKDDAAAIPEDIMAKYRMVIEEAPLWVTNMSASMRSQLKSMTELEQRALGAALPLCKPIFKEVGEAYMPHPEQVKWLEAFAEIVALMQENYPSVVDDINTER
ncbi:hypothetical protein CC86DRAFT_369048 [Ophiobolus disseminans]|uniref:F-box domain-containing protein n=1 Tax=Ophiobolus disseminans TaxID=1469910 RepID=A0A6A7A5E8_9PLEO|nr:hypothetical protein CC86DRAFT_369048 [Ophiobolus disseminans]